MADADLKPVYLLTGSDRPKIETALGRLRRHFEPEAVELVSAQEISGAGRCCALQRRQPLRRCAGSSSSRASTAAGTPRGGSRAAGRSQT